MFKTDFGFIMNVTGVSNQELAKHIGIKTQQVSDWINGHRPIPNKYKKLISDYIEVEIGLIDHLNENDKKSIIEFRLSKYFKKKVTIEFD